MAVDFSQSPVLRRLLQIGGRWLLEMECIEVIDAVILRPVLKYVEGEIDILSELTKHPSGQELANAAQRLLQESGGQASANRAFQPHQGKWVQIAFSPPRHLPKLHRPAGEDSAQSQREQSIPSQEFRKLSASQDKLAHVVDALRARVKQLESQLAMAQKLEQQLSETAEYCYALGQRLEQLESQIASGQFVAAEQFPEEQPEQAVAGTPLEGAAEPPLPKEATPTPMIPPAEETESALPPLLHFPAPEAINETLQQLVGDAVGVSEAPKKAVTKFGRSTQGWYVAAVLDDRERVVGAILVDPKATIQIGGSLMMLPALEMQSQHRTRSPSEDVLAAMSEVLNTLAPTINLIPDNPHVRTAYLEPFAFEAFSWVAAPAERLDLQERFGGLMAFLSRSPAEVATAKD